MDDLVDTTDIDEFVVISNHKFAQHFEDWKSNKQKTRPYEITVIDDGTSTNETRLGAVKDIQLAVEKLNLADDLLVMAGDNVLDAHSSKAGAIARVADIGLKNRCVYNPHGWAFNMRCSEKKKMMYAVIEKIAAPFCDKIICISDAEKQSALHKKICKEEKLQVIF
ncbi:WciNbeta, partial [human gut metagenome]